MNAVERVKSLCKERKIPISKLETDCGFANGYIGQLRKGTFPDDRLKTISEYLNVSVDYLITGKESEAQIDVALTNMDNRIKEYALKLADMQEDKQKLVLELIEKLN